jgi:hypothetical protein
VEGEDCSLIDPPYPAETKARGWRFDLDYEQIEQSSTWALAGPEVKPWLLMMWFTAWKQVPCASIPADEEVIAAMIGMPAKLWQKHSKVMLRGWAAASDGRMYHNVLTGRVREMLAKRRNESERKATYRQGNPPLSRGTDAGLQQDSQGSPTAVPADSTRKATPSLSPTEKKTPPTPRKRGEEPDGFSDFYSAYPKHVARNEAAKAFRKQSLTPAELPMLLAAIAAQKSQPDWLKDDGQFIPHPATWLNGRRWLDEVSTTVVPIRRLAF